MEEFKPKVFVSYAWTNNDYIMKVTHFVYRLISDGVDVLFDQFEMSPGKSLNNYMESCVKDPSITNVLILLSPEYKEKADSRKGGIGTETQIISTEVYQDLNSDKFIPILFDRMGKDVTSCVPIYLKDRYRLDLSDDANYENMYIALLRTIYKKPAFIKPAIGERPNWLDNKNDELNYDIGKIAKIKEIVNNKNINLKKFVLNTLHNEIISIPYGNLKLNTCEDFELSYVLFIKLRNQFIATLNEITEEKFVEELIFDFFEDLDSNFGNDDSDSIIKNNYLRILKHELIIETIAILYKNCRYEVIGSLIGRTYLCNKYFECEDFDNFFYSLSHHKIYELDLKLSEKYGDGVRRKLTGLGDYWINHLPEPLINRDEFVFADILISNLSIAINNKGCGWFALTYVYVVNENDVLRKIAISIKSKKLAQEYMPLFNSTSIDDLKIKIKNISDFDKNKSYRFGYNDTFETIELISKYIKQEDIGSLN